MHVLKVGRFTITSENLFCDKMYFTDGHSPIDTCDEKGYFTKDPNEIAGIKVFYTVPHLGFFKCDYLPYGYYRGVDGTWKLVVLESEHGFAKASPWSNDRACRDCQWLTGERALPCAVNPLAYGEGCHDYEV